MKTGAMQKIISTVVNQYQDPLADFKILIPPFLEAVNDLVQTSKSLNEGNKELFNG